MNLKEEILQKTNRGLEIFYFYMPIDFTPKRNFRNPLYEDKHASCNIYFDAQIQCYRMKDFGNEAYSGDCFWFVASILDLDIRKDFVKLLRTIIHDLQLNISLDKIEYSNVNRSIPKSTKGLLFNPQKTFVSPKNEKFFKIHEQPFKVEEKNFWLKYGITDKILNQYHVKSLFQYEGVSSQGNLFKINSTNKEPMFCYIMKDFVKIYRPNSKLRFLYGGREIRRLYLWF